MHATCKGAMSICNDFKNPLNALCILEHHASPADNLQTAQRTANTLQGSHERIHDTLIALWMVADQVLASRQHVARQACTDNCQYSVEVDCSQDQFGSVIKYGHVELGPNLNWMAGAVARNHT